MFSKGLTVKEKKEKAQKEKKITLKEKKREKDRAWKKKHYQKMKTDHPEILQMKACDQKIKCLEDLEYGEKDA